MIKRVFDVVSSLMAIITLSPLYLISGILIYISDPGPIFYRAKRVGEDGKIFKMYKFRSMKIVKNMNENKFKADESRIFGWGRIIRKTKIDELPQLINVIKGDMSVIGPRPASVDQIDIVRAGKYEEINKVKPGLSSPSALFDYIYGDDILDEELYKEKVLKKRLDLELYYIYNKSFRLDVKIILYTIISIVAISLGRRPLNILNELDAWSKMVQ